MSETAIKSAKKDPKIILLILGAAVGVFLLIFGSVSAGKQGSAAEESPTPAFTELDPERYAEEIEEQVKDICSRVQGAGSVSAVVTLKGGYRAVYATDSQSSGTGYKNSTVLIGSGSSEGAVLICYENPEISGIGVVCAGGDDPVVRERMISLISATFNIGTNKIYVASGH